MAVVPEVINASFYATTTAPWCHYCGARQSSAWSRGPWGPKTLCVPHYVSWHQKKSLSLDAYPAVRAAGARARARGCAVMTRRAVRAARAQLPTQPINPSANSEWKLRTAGGGDAAAGEGTMLDYSDMPLSPFALSAGTAPSVLLGAVPAAAAAPLPAAAAQVPVLARAAAFGEIVHM